MALLEFSDGHIGVSASRIDSSTELRKLIDGRAGLMIETADELREFVLLRISVVGEQVVSHVGLGCACAGITPVVMPVNGQSVFWLGADSEARLIGLCPLREKAAVKLPGAFYAFLAHSLHRAAIIHELGCVCVDNTGQVLWTLETRDVVKDFRIEHDQLTITDVAGQVASHPL